MRTAFTCAVALVALGSRKLDRLERGAIAAAGRCRQMPSAATPWSSCSPAKAARPVRRPTRCSAELASGAASSRCPIPSTIGTISAGTTRSPAPPTASASATMRAARGDGAVYTPQVVVDGMTHVNGADEQSDRPRHRRRLRRGSPASRFRSPSAPRATRSSSISARRPRNRTCAHGTVWLAIAKEAETVPIGAAKITGATLTYHHPVRELTPIGMWKGEPMTLRLPLKDLKTHRRRLRGDAAAGGEFGSDPRCRRISAPLAKPARRQARHSRRSVHKQKTGR